MTIWKAPIAGGTVYGLRRYCSMYRIDTGQTGEGDPAASEGRAVFAFKRRGVGGGRFRVEVEALAERLGCEGVVVCPGHTTAPTRLQLIFGAAIERTTEAPSRKRRHHEPIPADYRHSYTVHDADLPRAKRVIVLDDVATTGATLTHFADALRERGFEPECAALGIGPRLFRGAERFDLEISGPQADGAVEDLIDTILGVRSSPQRTVRTQAPPIPLDGDRRHERTPTRRVFHNALRTQAAVEALYGLPAAGETWHVLMAGAYDSFDLVDAMLAHATPATIADLRLATLGFNAANARRLIELHDAGAVRRCALIVSLYYESDPNEAEVCYRLARELPARGGWYLAARCHAKIIAAAFTDGRHFVIESSANLRTCHNLEQFTITHDRGLFEFHRSWMEEVRTHELARTERIAGAGST